MFKLTRYYALTSALVMLVSLTAALLVFRENQVREHVKHAEHENVRLAQTFVNVFWPRFADYVASAGERPPQALAEQPETRLIERELERLIQGLPILKIKLYNVQGTTIYSPVDDEIGDTVGDSPAFLTAALDGEVTSEIEHKERFRAFQGTVSDRYIVESYLPVRSKVGRVEGVFELYTDVTHFVEQLQQATLRLGFGLAAVFGLLYAALLLIIRYANRTMQRQHRDLVAHEDRLRDSERRFRAIADFSYDWESWLDPEGRPVWINPAVERLAGYPARECLAMSDYPLPMILDEDRPLIARHRTAASQGDFDTDVEFRIVCRNGQIKWVAASYQPIYDDDESFLGSRWSIRDVTDRKRAEKRLRDSEQRFRSLAQAAADAIVSADDTGRIISWNEAARVIFGYEEQEILGRNITRLMPERHRENHEAGMRRIRDDGAPRILGRPVEFEGLRRNGEEFPLELALSRWEMEGHTYFTAIIRDITERRQAEEEIRRSEATVRAIMNTSLDCIVAMDHEGRVVEFNPAAEQTFGYSRDAALGRELAELIIPPTLRDRHRQGLARYLEHGAGPALDSRLEMTAMRADGSEFPVELAISVIATDGPPLFTGYLRDITERQAAEAALRRSEEKYRTIIDSTAEGYWLIDPESRETLEVNRALCAMLGYEREEILGRTPLDFVDAENRAIFESQTSTIQDTDQRQYEITLKAKDGRDVDTVFSATTVRDERGRPVAAFAFVADITDRKAAERALAERSRDLERSNAELQQFAYVASHDLQEPLRMVTSYMGLLQRRYREQLDPEADEFIGFAVEGAQRMQRLIKDLLEYSRVGTRGRPFGEAALDTLLDDALANLKTAINDAGAEITREPLPTLAVDDIQILRLFQNLIGNALKYRKADVPPQIHIGAVDEGPVWHFRVADNGIGIEPDHFERVFLVFQRLHGRGEFEGTGIGLAVCKRIIERHGGRIWVESEPGGGSTFHFTIVKGLQGAGQA